MGVLSLSPFIPVDLFHLFWLEFPSPFPPLISSKYSHGLCPVRVENGAKVHQCSPHTYHPFPGSTHLLLILVGPLSTKHSAFTSPYCLRFLQRPSGLPVGHLWAKVSSFIFVELWISHPLLLSKGSISDTPPPPLILKLHLAKLLMLALSSLCSPGRP